MKIPVSCNPHYKCLFLNGFFFKIFYLLIFRERGKEGEREGEKHQRVVASCVPHTGELACNPGMCPKGESSLGPFAS